MHIGFNWIHSILNILNKLMTNRNLTIINFTIVIYFITLYLIFLFKINFMFIGFFVELLTIPFMIAQIVFFVIGINHLVKNRPGSVINLISIVVLLICVILTFGSYLKSRIWKHLILAIKPLHNWQILNKICVEQQNGNFSFFRSHNNLCKLNEMENWAQ